MPLDLAIKYYESVFYTSQYQLAYFYRWSLSAEEAYEDYATVLEKNTGDIGRELSTWYSGLISLDRSKESVNRVMAGIEKLQHPSVYLVIRSTDSVLGKVAWNDTRKTQLVKSAFHVLDSRPGNFIYAGGLLRKQIGDLKRCMIFYEKDFEIEETNAQHYWLAFLNNDLEALASIAESAHYSDLDQSRALNVLKDSEGDEFEELIRRSYRTRISAAPQDFWQIRSYAYYLNSKEDYQEAESVIYDWINGDYRYDGLEGVVAYNTLARTRISLEDYSTAWKLIEPVLSGMQGDSLSLGVKILRKLERFEEAESLAKRYIERYPNGLGSTNSMAQVYWQTGRYDDAARLYGAIPKYTSGYNWDHSISVAFYFIFSEKEGAEAKAAGSALLDAGITPMNVSELANYMGQYADSEVAFEMQMLVHKRNPQNKLVTRRIINGMRDVAGDESAAVWGKEALSQFKVFSINLGFYDMQHWKSMWDIVDASVAKRYVDNIWLIRAAAYVHPDNVEKEHRAELLEYYETAGTGKYDTIGKYLMDLVDESEVLGLITNKKTMSECGYYLGLKHHSIGDYEEALDWYRTAAESESAGDWETTWAIRVTSNWSKIGSLQRVMVEEEKIEDDSSG